MATKTIYACGCTVIKDGSVNDFARFCNKHRSSYVATDDMDTRVSKIEAFSETEFTETYAEAGQTWMSPLKNVC